MATYRGSCHCGAVQFECRAPDEPVVYDCNCSMCTRAGLARIVPFNGQHWEAAIQRQGELGS